MVISHLLTGMSLQVEGPITPPFRWWNNPQKSPFSFGHFYGLDNSKSITGIGAHLVDDGQSFASHAIETLIQTDELLCFPTNKKQI